jgi:hypothetical protein
LWNQKKSSIDILDQFFFPSPITSAQRPAITLADMKRVGNVYYFPPAFMRNREEKDNGDVENVLLTGGYHH